MKIASIFRSASGTRSSAIESSGGRSFHAPAAGKRLRDATAQMRVGSIGASRGSVAALPTSRTAKRNKRGDGQGLSLPAASPGSRNGSYARGNATPRSSRVGARSSECRQQHCLRCRARASARSSMPPVHRGHECRSQPARSSLSRVPIRIDYLPEVIVHAAPSARWIGSRRGSPRTGTPSTSRAVHRRVYSRMSESMPGSSARLSQPACARSTSPRPRLIAPTRTGIAATGAAR
jgi:hypothetical protein